jgi:nucleotide-binding universal stress UspA family protein
MLKTIFVAPIFTSNIAERPPSDALVRYAIELAASQQAHLDVAMVAIKFSAPASIFVSEARELIENANAERCQHARQLGNEILTRAHAAGVSGSVEVAHDHYHRVAETITHMARLADISVMQADDESISLQEGMLQEVLLGSGRPVIAVPPAWSGPAKPDKVIFTWDGGAKSARALGDALPLMIQANEIEIVSISGDPDASKRIDAAEIAPHVSRYCKKVTVTSLPSHGDIAATLARHAQLTRANLIVMGAFARTKLRQMILGGVTRTMISNPPVPVLLSY